MKNKIMNCKNILFLSFFFFFLQLPNKMAAQTYRQQFDIIYKNGVSGDDPSLIHNLGTGIASGARVLEGLILMYKTTKDLKYLNEFIIMSKRMMDRRNDNFVNVYNNGHIAQMPYYDSGWWVWDYGNCSNAFPPVFGGGPYCYPIDITSKGWTRINAVEGGERRGFYTHFMESGEITTPMARFFLLFNENPTLASLTVPEEALSSSPPNYYGTGITVTTYTQYAAWLKTKVYETLTWELNTHYNPDNQYFWAGDEDGWGADGCKAINQQSAIGRAYILMSQVASFDGNSAATDYLNTAKRIGTHVHETVYDFTHQAVMGDHFTLPNHKNWFAWCHAPECSGALWEDIGHAWLEEEFIDLMLTYGISNSDGSSFLSSDIEQMANGFIYVMCQAAREIRMNVYGTNTNCNQACPPDYTPNATYQFQDQYYNAGHYVFLSKYNPGVYQAISDLYSPNQSLFGHSNFIFGGINGNSDIDILGIAQLAAYEHLFNPISIKPNSGGHSYTSLASGDFDADGQQEFASLNSGVGVTTIETYTFTSDNVINSTYSNGLSGNHKYFAAGEINTTHNGDEIVTIDIQNNVIVLLQEQSGYLTPITQITIPSGAYTGIAIGEFSSAYPGKEIIINSTSAGSETFKMYGYNSTLNSLVPITTNNTIGGVISKFTVGDFDGNGTDEIALIDNPANLIKTYSFNTGNLFVLNASSGSVNLTNLIDEEGLTSGDFDGDGIDEIVLYKQVNELDGSYQIYKETSPSTIALKGEEIFQLIQRNGVMCNMRLNNFPASDVLVTIRNFDGQISAFNMDGLCPSLYLSNRIIDEAASIDNRFTPSVTNTFPIDYHVSNILTASNFTIASSGRVDMTAGKAIIFNPGFISETGSVTYAHIDAGIACTNPAFRQAASPAPSHNSPIKPHEVKDDPRIKVSPNPNNGVFDLMTSIDSSKDIYVYDANGKIVYENKSVTENKITINLSGFAEGIYIVRIADGSTSLTKKIIKQ
jgi:hypothetical protein